MSVIIRLEPGSELPEEEVRRLAGAVRSCKVLAFPTDTVYGLGSTGLVKAAWRRIYQIKGRPSLKPLPILVHSREAASRWVEWTPAGEALARRFWPGALTLVLKPTAEGRLLSFAEYQTLAIRVPGHPGLLKLIEASGVPWASTSANLSGLPPLADGEAVARQFDGRADFILCAGPAPGTESTLVDASSGPVRVLREGAVGSAQIREACAMR